MSEKTSERKGTLAEAELDKIVSENCGENKTLTPETPQKLKDLLAKTKELISD